MMTTAMLLALLVGLLAFAVLVILPLDGGAGRRAPVRVEVAQRTRHLAAPPTSRRRGCS